MTGELRVEGLVWRVAGAEILSGASLTVPAGTLTALVGRSGAGKTTLLRLLAGLIEPREGTITVDGDALHRTPAGARGVAMVFQEPRLLPHLSLADNVALPLALRGVRRRARRAEAREALTQVGLDDRASDHPAGLSGGEQQRVALARALCARPRLLLLDEPLAAVDPERREDLRALIGEVQQASGATAVLVTHSTQEAAELGDRIAFLGAGVIQQHAPPAELFCRPATYEIAAFFEATNLICTARGVAVCRPEHVQLAAPERSSAQATVRAVVHHGSHLRVTLDAGPGAPRLVALAPTSSGLRVDDHVAWTVDPEHLWVPGDPHPFGGAAGGR